MMILVITSALMGKLHKNLDQELQLINDYWNKKKTVFSRDES